MSTDTEGKFGFKSVQLFKDCVLGIGAYGKVCRAQCDLLPCAAKIMHETLFDPSLNEKVRPHHEHRLPFSRFKRECEFLSVLKHPNIVQYLGTFRDPDSHLPVLLMELMDDSLTQFLEGSLKPIPLHVQVDICHDIVLALFFLHSNGLIHRDLSGNNVLMLGSVRAKVTDLGMARLVDPKQLSMLTRTMCPGTDVYMPPEAVDDPPLYTEKIDCFSFGVILIQILTKQFPAPTARKKKMKIDHPALGATVVEVPVPEIERRQDHIKKIDSSHPLLSIALECLSNSTANRPSSEDLCKRLSTLKDGKKYKDSKKAINYTYHVNSGSTKTAAKRGVDNSGVQEKEEQLQQAKQQLEERQRTIDSLQKRIEELELGQQSVQGESPNLKFVWKGTKRAPCEMYRGADAVVSNNMAYFRPAGSLVIYAYNIHDGKWKQLPKYPNEKCSIVIIDNLLTTVGGARDGRVTNELFSLMGEGKRQKWEEQFPPMPTKRCRMSVLYVQRTVVAAGGGRDGAVLDTVEMLNIDTQEWTTATSLPEPLYRSSATTCGNSIYLLGGFDRKHLAVRSVLACPISLLLKSDKPSATNTPTNLWSRIADLPVTQSTCAALRGQLLAVGGMEIDRAHYRSADIRMYDPIRQEWEVIGRMSTPRRRCYTAVLYDEHLVVVGGLADDGRHGMDAFEIASVTVS